MASRRAAGLAMAMVVWTSVSAHAQGAADPQVEKGRAVVAQVCTTCHTTLGRMLQVHRQTREQWRDLVFFMISRGAQVMPDEIDAVTAFLVATAGRDRPAEKSPAPNNAAPGNNVR